MASRAVDDSRVATHLSRLPDSSIRLSAVTALLEKCSIRPSGAEAEVAATAALVVDRLRKMKQLERSTRAGILTDRSQILFNTRPSPTLIKGDPVVTASEVLATLGAVQGPCTRRSGEVWWLALASTAVFGAAHYVLTKIMSTSPAAPLEAGKWFAAQPAFWLKLRGVAARAFGVRERDLYIVDNLRRREIVMYILSQVHAGVTTAWAIWEIRQRGWRGGFIEETGPSSSPRLLAFIQGFFLHDMLALVRSGLWREDVVAIVHHIIGSTITADLVSGGSGLALLPDTMTLEMSTLFLNIGWLLKEFNRTSTLKYKSSVIGFVATFFVFRVVWFPFFIHRTKTRSPALWLAKGKVTYVIYAAALLQFYWFAKLLKMARKVL